LCGQKYYPFIQNTAIFNKGFVFTLLPLSFLWFDVAFTLIRRAIRGCRLTEAHRDHMIHVLHDKGYSHTFVTLLYGAGTLYMGSLSYMCHRGTLGFEALLILYAAVQFVWVVFVFKIATKKHKNLTSVL
jgi:hypothetical protein